MSCSREPDLVLDTTAAAAGLIGLMAAGDVPVAQVLHEVQHEFFVHGRPLGSPGVLADVADRLGLDGAALEVFAASSAPTRWRPRTSSWRPSSPSRAARC